VIFGVGISCPPVPGAHGCVISLPSEYRGTAGAQPDRLDAANAVWWIEAFERLRARGGTAPSAILESPIGELGKATRLGIRADAQARKLQAAARLAVTHFGGDLGSRLAAISLAEARRALRRFPAIGEPAADRIPLQAGLHAVPALDSNGLRVLVRLGLAQDAPSYAVSHGLRSRFCATRCQPSGRRCFALLLRLHDPQEAACASAG
jgi:hypothetical protein